MYVETKVSVLFNEPKLLKFKSQRWLRSYTSSFSALQRAEIAEISAPGIRRHAATARFSALQRAEIAEITTATLKAAKSRLCFSALQRAEIAEIRALAV